MKSEIIAPYAPILVESTRSIGYSFETALADIIDNSIGKNAQNIYVNFDSMTPRYVAIIDDACGMDELELKSAMRYGSKSTHDLRDDNDLGRFGLGLKMASLSQCRILTVISKKNNNFCGASWNLDYVIEKKDWALQIFNESEIKKNRFFEKLEPIESGTIVLWEVFDRMETSASNSPKVFDEKIQLARKHISLVFHRFMSDERNGKRVKIFFNNEKVNPIDPFLTDNLATQPMTEQTFLIEEHEIKVKPYVLPYISKLKAKDKQQLGDINDLRKNQGFYIYRNRRLIIWGTWFRLIKQYELNKLARVKVDIPATLDFMWEIDIKKSTASLPDVIKKNLVTIVEKTVGRSEKVYKYRGRKIKTNDEQHVWDLKDNRGSYQYVVNRELPLYKQLDQQLDENGQNCLDSFLISLENAFPYGDVYYRLAKNENSIKANDLDFDVIYKVGADAIASMQSFDGDVSAFLDTLDKNDLFKKYPDVVEQLREDFKDVK